MLNFSIYYEPKKEILVKSFVFFIALLQPVLFVLLDSLSLKKFQDITNFPFSKWKQNLIAISASFEIDILHKKISENYESNHILRGMIREGTLKF